MTATQRDQPGQGPATRCRKCPQGPARPPAGPGPRPQFCTTGCRRAAENEVRRFDRAIERAEGEVQHLRQRVDSDGATVPPSIPRQLDWWRGELARLGRRLAELLDDPDEGGDRP